jgi:hypothetical protein
MIGLALARFDPDVEETLLRVYGVDSHSVTFRKLKVLLNRIPLGEWNKDQGPASWSGEAYLLANVIDAINQASWVYAQSQSKKKVPMPKPITRPGQEEKKLSWREVGDAMAGMEGVIVHDC